MADIISQDRLVRIRIGITARNGGHRSGGRLLLDRLRCFARRCGGQIRVQRFASGVLNADATKWMGGISIDENPSITTLRHLPVLVPGQIAHVLLGRIVRVRFLYADRAHGHVRHLRGGHGELDVAERRQLLGDLIVAGQRHANDQLVCGVGACKQNVIIISANFGPPAARTYPVPLWAAAGSATRSPDGGARTWPGRRSPRWATPAADRRCPGCARCPWSCRCAGGRTWPSRICAMANVSTIVLIE